MTPDDARQALYEAQARAEKLKRRLERDTAQALENDPGRALWGQRYAVANERRLEEAEADIARLIPLAGEYQPQRASHITFTPRDLARDPLSPAEIEGLEIPAFLRRTT